MEEKLKLCNITFSGAITVNGPMFDIHDNGTVINRFVADTAQRHPCLLPSGQLSAHPAPAPLAKGTEGHPGICRFRVPPGPDLRLPSGIAGPGPRTGSAAPRLPPPEDEGGAGTGYQPVPPVISDFSGFSNFRFQKGKMDIMPMQKYKKNICIILP